MFTEKCKSRAVTSQSIQFCSCLNIKYDCRSRTGESHMCEAVCARSNLSLHGVTNSVLFSQGKDGSYGTSLALGTAQDPGCDVLLAYKQNGRRLAPDHVSQISEWALQF